MINDIIIKTFSFYLGSTIKYKVVDSEMEKESAEVLTGIVTVGLLNSIFKEKIFDCKLQLRSLLDITKEEALELIEMCVLDSEKWIDKQNWTLRWMGGKEVTLSAEGGNYLFIIFENGDVNCYYRHIGEEAEMIETRQQTQLAQYYYLKGFNVPMFMTSKTPVELGIAELVDQKNISKSGFSR